MLATISDPEMGIADIFIDSGASADDLVHTLKSLEADEDHRHDLRDQILEQSVDRYDLLKGIQIKLKTEDFKLTQRSKITSSESLVLSGDATFNDLCEGLSEFFDNEDEKQRSLDSILLRMCTNKMLANKTFTVDIRERLSVLSLVDDEVAQAAIAKFIGSSQD